MKWVFIVAFVVPSVVCCLALAVYSGFSFQTIPTQVLELAADASQRPAPAGTLSVYTCMDAASESAASDGAGALPRASAPCKLMGWTHASIDEMAHRAAGLLWLLYLTVVTLTWMIVEATGPFDRSLARLLAKLAEQKRRWLRPPIDMGR
ncbi:MULTISPECIES: hypothetical protein [unclassified Burkholderia]|uniref:hypothetical protein n=1 Tax=unclassified Burkholderia TaxID=2613784 RepID=UPI002AB1DFCE|nr:MULTISPECIES: hypothetical protein [unclassified Burkholderia]